MVGGILLVSAIIRLNQQVQRQLTNFVKKHIAIYHLVMGIVHGLTNLGGAFLTIFASTTSADKKAIRYTIAHYYLLFSVVQILILTAIIKFSGMFSINLFTAVVSASIYLLIGNKIFLRANNDGFQIALSGFMAACGFAILLNP